MAFDFSDVGKMIDRMFDYIMLDSNQSQESSTPGEISQAESIHPNDGLFGNGFTPYTYTLSGRVENDTPQILELTFSSVIHSLTDLRIKGTAAKDLVSHPYSGHIENMLGLGTREVLVILKYPVAHYDRIFVSVPSLGITDTLIENRVMDNGLGKPIAPEYYQGGPAAFDGKYGNPNQAKYIDDHNPENLQGVRSVLKNANDHNYILFRAGGNMDGNFPESLDPSYILNASHITLAGWGPSSPPIMRKNRFFTNESHVHLDNIVWHRGITVSMYKQNDLKEVHTSSYFKDSITFGTPKKILDYIIVSNSTITGGLDEVLTIYGNSISQSEKPSFL